MNAATDQVPDALRLAAALVNAERRDCVRYRLVMLGLLLGWFLTLVGGVCLGAYPIAVDDLIRVLAGVTGNPDAAPSARYADIVWQLRLPRVLFASLVGAGLAAAGTVLQGLLRNPLADPGLLGTTSGATLGACGFILATGSLARAESLPLGLPLAAFLGALATTATLYALARRDGQVEIGQLLLGGIAVNAIVGAAIAVFAYIANDEQLRNLTFWNLGSLAGASWRVLSVAAPAVVFAFAGLWRIALALDLLALGEREALHLGVSVSQVKRLAILASTLIVGVLVAYCGGIAFVGLLAPHLARLLVGVNHRRLLPAAVLLGAWLLVAADLAARTLVAPAELPIGALTALLGAPLFIALLKRQTGAT